MSNSPSPFNWIGFEAGVAQTPHAPSAARDQPVDRPSIARQVGRLSVDQQLG